MTTPTPAHDGAAVTRITRIMSLALGIGSIVFNSLVIPEFIAQYSSFNPFWSWAVVAGFAGGSIAMVGLSWVVPPRILTALSGVVAASYLLGLATLVPALVTGALDPSLGAPWLFGPSVIAFSAATMAWRPAIAWVYLGAVAGLIAFDRVMASPVDVVSLAAQSGIFALFFGAVFTALGITTRRAGETLDAAAAAAIVETRVAGSARAQARERAKSEAFVHDSVLVALLASANGSPGSDAAAAREAARALAQIDSIEAGTEEEPRTAEQFVWALQAIATDLAPDAVFSYELGADPLVPNSVADALFEAAGEAIRNSRAHAGGDDVSRAIHVDVSDSRLDVTVLDDGAGFDVDALPAARLGIAVSIRARMAAEPGGAAFIVSEPDRGTRVLLRWTVQP